MAVKLTLTPEQFMYFTMLVTAAIEEIADRVNKMNHDEVIAGIAEETIRKATNMKKIESH